MSYMIEGGGSRTLTKSKSWLYKYPLESERLLSQIGDVVISYLVEQVKAGAQVIPLNLKAPTLSINIFRIQFRFVLFPLSTTRSTN